MTKDKTVTMSRELAESLLTEATNQNWSALNQVLNAPTACRECMGTGGIGRLETCEYCKGTGKIAAPVVERQEPVAFVRVTEGNPKVSFFSWVQKVPLPVGKYQLYTSPPTPVEVDERAEFDAWTVRKGRVVGYSGWREDFEIWQARACITRSRS